MEVYDYNQETGNFDLNFRDEFDTLDPRWGLGDITWGPTKFIPENVSIKDGKLVLKVEKEQDHDGSDSDDSDSDEDSDDGSDDDRDFHVLPPP